MKSGNFEKALLRAIIAVVILAFFYAGGLSVWAQGEVGKDATVETVPLDKDNLSKTDSKVDSKVESVTENAKNTKNTTVESPASVKDDASFSNPEAGEDSESEIISISDALRQGQLQHEKNLVDKFLFGIAVLFLLIAFLLFNSLPPSAPESDAS